MGRPKGSMNVALVDLYVIGKKRCTSCKKIKTHDEFVKNGTKSHTIDGLTGCCKECQRDAKAQWDREHPGSKSIHRQAWRERNHDHVQLKSVEYAATRRARQLGQFVEEIDRDVVWNSDNGKCGICEKYIGDHKHFDIDHIVPLSRGGEHSYANVQVAHPKCNKRKGAHLEEEHVKQMMSLRKRAVERVCATNNIDKRRVSWTRS